MGIVYVLTHRQMPNVVKIGYTEGPIETRIAQLSSASGVPGKFDCAGAWIFTNARKVEKSLHDAFSGNRVENEFFEIHPDRVIAILRQFGKRNVTPGRDKRNTKTLTDAQKKKRVPNFTFMSVNIGLGETLISSLDSTITCRVVGDKKVEFEGETMSLSAAAKKVIMRLGKTWSSISGPNHWMYGNPPKLLSKLRKENET